VVIVMPTLDLCIICHKNIFDEFPSRMMLVILTEIRQ